MFEFVNWLLRQIRGIVALVSFYAFLERASRQITGIVDAANWLGRKIVAVANWFGQQVMRIVAVINWLGRQVMRIFALCRRIYRWFTWVAGVFAVLISWWKFLIKFELANPITEPVWFAEDVALLGQWALIDYVYPLQVYPTAWYGFVTCSAAYTMYHAAPQLLKIRHSYLDYLGLGRGARPSTVGGWLRHQCLTYIVKAFRVDVLSRPFLDPYEVPYNGRLIDLPERTQPRPEILGLGPIKQATATNREKAAHFQRGFEDLVRTHQGNLQSVIGARTGLPTLQLNLEARPAPARGAMNSKLEWGGEIAHIRPDGGLQVTLHPADADEVVQHGWGQRDSLAVLNELWLWRFFYHRVLRRSTPVPSSSVIVYAPLDDAETDIVVRIVEAGVWWAEL